MSKEIRLKAPIRFEAIKGALKALDVPVNLEAKAHPRHPYRRISELPLGEFWPPIVPRHLFKVLG